MPRHKFYDVPGGNTMTLDVVDVSTGYRQTSFMMPEGVRDGFFRDIKNVNIRDDEVLFCSYPKTGSTWLLEMVTMMKNKSAKLVQGNRLDGMIESKPPATLQDMTSPRLLNTHIKVRYLPSEAVEKKIKTVFLYRNPKDVAVSFYHHAKGIKTYEYGGKFENYLQMFMRGEVDYGSYPEYLLEWQEHIGTNPDIPVHILNYEDLKEDCFTELKKLRVFLDYDAPDDLVAEIADFCSMDKLKAYKQQHATPEVIKLSKMFINDGFDFMRKGEIGDWRNWLTVAQNDVFDTWWKQETRGLDMFKFRYTNTYRQLTWQGTTMLEVTSF